MPKKIHVQAKKEIEALMYENVDCVAKFGISKWSDVWDSSFETKNILEEGKVIDFTYSEKALSLQSVLNEGVEKALEVARANYTPEFFDYLLGEVRIEGDFKTYNRPHIRTEKKYFNIPIPEVILWKGSTNSVRNFTNRFPIGFYDLNLVSTHAT